jgi:hypothetical protein
MSVAGTWSLKRLVGLLERGRLVGVLSYAEIAGAGSELDLDKSDVEESHGSLSGWSSSWSTTSIRHRPRRRWSALHPAQGFGGCQGGHRGADHQGQSSRLKQSAR